MYLAAGGVAKRLGLSTNTVRRYVQKGMLPDPDVVLDDGTRRLRGWAAETIDAWQSQRPRPRVTPPAQPTGEEADQ